MSRVALFTLFYLATFLQAGSYGLTFLLPRLFDGFGANKKVVGVMLFLTTLATLCAVYFAGHLSNAFGRLGTLAGACAAIASALVLYGIAPGIGIELALASLLMGAGWGLTYALSPVVLTGLITAEERVRFFALLSVALMAGFGLSPVLAAMMERAEFEIEDAFFVTAALCAVAAVIFALLHGPVHAHQTVAAGGKSHLTLAGIGAILRSPARLPVIMVCIGASVFAGMNNFQTVFAEERGLDYAIYFLAYTVTVVLFRVVLARFKGGRTPYLTIAALQYVMAGAVVLFLLSAGNLPLYLAVAVLFGIGYGVSYPILAAMAVNDAEEALVPQTLLLFALSYFIGIFGFPLVAGWMIVEMGSASLLVLVAILAGWEASLALRRALVRRRLQLVRPWAPKRKRRAGSGTWS